MLLAIFATIATTAIIIAAFLDYTPFTRTGNQTLTACTLAKHQQLDILAYGRTCRAYNISKSTYIASLATASPLTLSLLSKDYGNTYATRALKARTEARLAMIRATIERKYPEYYARA